MLRRLSLLVLPAKGMAPTSLGTPSQLTSPNVRPRTARRYPQARDADIGRRALLRARPPALNAGRRDIAGELAGAISAGTERPCLRELARP